MTVARDAVEKTVGSLAELSGISVSRPDTTEQETGTSMWCSPISFGPIASGTTRSVADLTQIKKP